MKKLIGGAALLFLVDGNGQVVGRYGPRDTPDAIRGELARLLEPVP